MFRIIHKGTLAAALAAAAWGSGTAFAAPISKDDPSASGSYRPEQIVTLKEQGKPDRKCRILSTIKQSNGRLAYTLKAFDNGETLTIYEGPMKDVPIRTTSSPSKILPVGPSATPAPEIPAENPAMKPASGKLTAVAAEASNMPPPKPVTKSWWARVFGPSTPTAKPAPSACTTCRNGNPVPLVNPRPAPIASDKVAAAAPSATMKPIPSAVPASVAPITPPTPTAVVTPALPMTAPPPTVPLSMSAVEPQLPAVTPTTLPQTVTSPGPLPQYGAVAEVNPDDLKISQLKVALKGAIRPSERELAAEGLIDSYRGNSPEIRALVLVTAQEDPAPTVRLTCLRCLAKQGIKDDALMTALMTAQQDRDSRVREEAGFSLARLSAKK